MPIPYLEIQPNNRLHLVRSDYQWPSEDHLGAVYCGNDLGEKRFKVRQPERYTSGYEL